MNIVSPRKQKSRKLKPSKTFPTSSPDSRLVLSLQRSPTNAFRLVSPPNSPEISLDDADLLLLDSKFESGETHLKMSTELEDLIGHDDIFQLHSIFKQYAPLNTSLIHHISPSMGCEFDLQNVFNHFVGEEEKQLSPMLLSHPLHPVVTDMNASQTSFVSVSSHQDSICSSLYCSDVEDISAVYSSTSEQEQEEEETNLEMGHHFKRQKKSAEFTVRIARKKASKEAHDVLLNWVLSNKETPYPSQAQKHELASRTGSFYVILKDTESHLFRYVRGASAALDEQYAKAKVGTTHHCQALRQF
jgi:hypothetical protein